MERDRESGRVSKRRIKLKRENERESRRVLRFGRGGERKIEIEIKRVGEKNDYYGKRELGRYKMAETESITVSIYINQLYL